MENMVLEIGGFALFFAMVVLCLMMWNVFSRIEKLETPRDGDFHIETDCNGVAIFRVFESGQWTEMLANRVAFLDGHLMYKIGTDFVPVPESDCDKISLLEKYLGVELVVTPEKKEYKLTNVVTQKGCKCKK